MIIDREYFTVGLSSEIALGLSLSEMGTVAQFELQDICPVPGVTNFWYGVANFKGSLLWILDSARFFGLETERHKKPTKLTTVIVKEQGQDNNQQAAIVTDRLMGIVTLDPSGLNPVPESALPQLQQCCSQLARLEEQTIYILDCGALLAQLQQQSILVSA